MISIPPVVLFTVFNPLITFLIGFVVGNSLNNRNIKWIVGVVIFTLFHLFIVFINGMSFGNVSTWIYLILYIITGIVGIFMAAYRKKNYS
ncbi:hypothetical protein JCM19037_1141 [Geomicrobium sp. JCM 19037]|uniref:hypothetical protein n=1 Tax=unclassified Geomicrobium TaxID=2628951 RepID=UPI00045F2A11|nr:hypothetical protein [Geomicrobium sp. JCM 19037]GAK02872.1 hypothetical protein JCM19037_1141 [Geomicrobium sp. JCM 19037]